MFESGDFIMNKKILLLLALLSGSVGLSASQAALALLTAKTGYDFYCQNADSINALPTSAKIAGLGLVGLAGYGAHRCYKNLSEKNKINTLTGLGIAAGIASGCASLYGHSSADPLWFGANVCGRRLNKYETGSCKNRAIVGKMYINDVQTASALLMARQYILSNNYKESMDNLKIASYCLADGVKAYAILGTLVRTVSNMDTVLIDHGFMRRDEDGSLYFPARR